MTTVRNLTDDEKRELRKLLDELHAHVEICPECNEAPTPATPADVAGAGLCTRGAELYGAWFAWIARAS